MKRIAATMLVTVLAVSNAWGGTVTFAPVGPTSVMRGETVQFDVSVMGDGQFDTPSILMGSDDLQLMSFVYDPDFAAGAAFPPVDPFPFGVYASDLFASAFFNDPFAAGDPVLMGTLTIGVGDLPDGEYAVHVDSERDGLVSNLALGVASEPLLGMGMVNVIPIPEPATLALLGVGGLVALRRRRR